LTDDEHLLDSAQALFDAIWSGRECGACKLRSKCARPSARARALSVAARFSAASSSSACRLQRLWPGRRARLPRRRRRPGARLARTGPSPRSAGRLRRARLRFDSELLSGMHSARS
jgi:hypothetical protein